MRDLYYRLLDGRGGAQRPDGLEAGQIAVNDRVVATRWLSTPAQGSGVVEAADVDAVKGIDGFLVEEQRRSRIV